MRRETQDMSSTEKTSTGVSHPEDGQNRIARGTRGAAERNGRERDLASKKRIPYTLKKVEAGKLLIMNSLTLTQMATKLVSPLESTSVAFLDEAG